MCGMASLPPSSTDSDSLSDFGFRFLGVVCCFFGVDAPALRGLGVLGLGALFTEASESSESACSLRLLGFGGVRSNADSEGRALDEWEEAGVPLFGGDGLLL